MGILAFCCSRSLRLAANYEIPIFLDEAAATFAIQILKSYRKFLSRHTGRTCLFRIPCSVQAVAFLQKYGYNQGVKLASRQLQRCGGPSTIIRTVEGEVVLTCADGTVWSGEALAPVIVSRCTN